MENIENNGLEPEKENNEIDNPERLQEFSGTSIGSFDNNDQVSDSSIGTGSSDQGIEPGEEEEEDEFRKALSGQSGAGFSDGTHEDGEQRENGSGVTEHISGNHDTNSSSAGDSGTVEKNERPSKGLVEEGPGPDS